MASNIDPTKPTQGAALTADVRANFSAAKQEIELLQARAGVLGAAGPFIPFPLANDPGFILTTGLHTQDFTQLTDLTIGDPLPVQLPQADLFLLLNVNWSLYSNNAVGLRRHYLAFYTAPNSTATADQFSLDLFAVREQVATPANNLLAQDHRCMIAPAFWVNNQLQVYSNYQYTAGNSHAISFVTVLGYAYR